MQGMQRRLKFGVCLGKGVPKGSVIRASFYLFIFFHENAYLEVFVDQYHGLLFIWEHERFNEFPLYDINTL